MMRIGGSSVAYIKFKPLTPTMQFNRMVTVEELDKELLNLIDKSETIQFAFSSGRDYGVLTDKRIIISDRKGVRGFRRKFYSIIYDSISTYNLDIHNFDTTIEMTVDSGYIVILSFYKPIPLEIMFDIYKFLSSKILEK